MTLRFIIYGPAYEALQQRKHLTPTDLRVFHALVSSTADQNFIYRKPAYVAGWLRIPVTEARRSIDTLVTTGLILRGPRIGNTHMHRLSPFYGWAGTPDPLSRIAPTKWPDPETWAERCRPTEKKQHAA